MRMMARRASLTLATLLFVSCSGSDAPSNAGLTNAAPDLADPPLEANTPDLTENQTAETAPCPASPGSMCIGPLIVRGEGFNLMREDRGSGADYIIAQGTLVFENRTSGPVRFAMLDERMRVGLDTGQNLGTTNYSFSGLRFCGRDGAACLQESPERFQTLVPGDSAIRLNATFRGDEMASLRGANPTAASATITFQVYAVDATNAGGALSISLPNVPLRNQTSR